MAIDYTRRTAKSSAPGTPARSDPPPPAARIDYTRPDRTPTPAAPTGAAHPAEPPADHRAKVTLTKTRPTVSLTKQGGGPGSMRLNLSWTARPPSQTARSGRRRGDDIDLDLGCLWEFSDGSKGVVQALGHAFSAYDHAGNQIISLDGDDRTGAGGENLHLDLTVPGLIRRVLFFAMIYDGTPNWAGADAIVTVYPQSGPQIETRLDTADDRARICAIALLDHDRGGLRLNRLNHYIHGSQRALDAEYSWGLRWTAGSK